MAFLDFIPDNNTEKERGVFMAARKAPRGETVTFQVFIGNKVLEKLRDEKGRPWTDEQVEKLVIRIGTGDDSGQMLIAALGIGNVILKSRKSETKGHGRYFSVKNFPGVPVMKQQEVTWKAVEEKNGTFLHILQYDTSPVSDADIRKSDASSMSKSVVKKSEPVAVAGTSETVVKEAPKHEKIDLATASAAMSRAVKK